MNYRQWKKNYKKLHGVNPPASIDRRKRRRQRTRVENVFANADFKRRRLLRLMKGAAGNDKYFIVYRNFRAKRNYRIFKRHSRKG